MGDWTDTVPAPFGVSYYNSYAGIHSVGAATGTLGSLAQGVPTANRALLVPFRLLAPIRITKLFIYNGPTISGNLDLGIYDKEGTRLVSTGSTAQSGASVLQIISLGTALRCGVGQFYTAMVMDNTTGTFYRAVLSFSLSRVIGLAQMESAFPLPSTITFAVYGTGYLPVIGFISEEG